MKQETKRTLMELSIICVICWGVVLLGCIRRSVTMTLFDVEAGEITFLIYGCIRSIRVSRSSDRWYRTSLLVCLGAAACFGLSCGMRILLWAEVGMALSVAEYLLMVAICGTMSFGAAYMRKFAPKPPVLAALKGQGAGALQAAWKQIPRGRRWFTCIAMLIVLTAAILCMGAEYAMEHSPGRDFQMVMTVMAGLSGVCGFLLVPTTIISECCRSAKRGTALHYCVTSSVLISMCFYGFFFGVGILPWLRYKNQDLDGALWLKISLGYFLALILISSIAAAIAKRNTVQKSRSLEASAGGGK